MGRKRVQKLQKLESTDEAEIYNILECNNDVADKKLKERLPIINCERGAEILVVPDLKAMNHAIKTHVTEHRKTEKINTQKNETKPNKVSQLLSQLTLIKISEQINTQSSDSNRNPLSVHTYLLSK
jgi:hypothetical protein